MFLVQCVGTYFSLKQKEFRGAMKNGNGMKRVMVKIKRVQKLIIK